MGNKEKQFKTVLGEEKCSISMEAGRFFFFSMKRRTEGQKEGWKERGREGND